jgi:dTDP-4-amino-4,6-dideoxygalactose transaminase
MILVTKPFLPPREEYEQYIKGIWEREWLTNNGPLVNDLEISLKRYLNLKHLLYLSNGTIALQLAIRALGLHGEIITTPFSYVATTSSIVWEGCKPVFVDIDPRTLNIDAGRIEEKITPQTVGILATHVYGNACDIAAITAIAEKHGLKVIFDAAHCFGTKYKGRSVFDYGDVSTTSFHATKLFHTIEGGAVFTQCPDLLKKLAFMRNFGHNGPEAFAELGINGKSCEFHAAMGLVNLRYIEDILLKRKEASTYYDTYLQYVKAFKPAITPDTTYNYAYYPLVFESEELLLRCIKTLNNNNVFPRRYFYPALSSNLPYLDKVDLPVTEDISRRVICLPMYYTLSKGEIDMTMRLILRAQNN